MTIFRSAFQIFGVIDPWKHRGWCVTEQGWAAATDQIMRTNDSRVAMPLADVLLA